MPKALPFRPAPEGPPPDKRGHRNPLHEWLDAHPGEWAVIPNASSGTGGQLKKYGYEVTVRGLPDTSPQKYDIYVRKPTKATKVASPYTGKKRGPKKGIRNDHQRYLTDDQVRELRAKWASGQFTQRELADEYGLPQPVICVIVNRKRYADVPDHAPQPLPPPTIERTQP